MLDLQMYRNMDFKAAMSFPFPYYRAGGIHSSIMFFKSSLGFDHADACGTVASFVIFAPMRTALWHVHLGFHHRNQETDAVAVLLRVSLAPHCETRVAVGVVLAPLVAC